jgi:hypothetical protein
MSEDRIAEALERRSANHMGRRSRDRRVSTVVRNVFRTSVTDDELDDKARWLDGQVRGWTAARTL